METKKLVPRLKAEITMAGGSYPKQAQLPEVIYLFNIYVIPVETAGKQWVRRQDTLQADYDLNKPNAWRVTIK